MKKQIAFAICLSLLCLPAAAQNSLNTPQDPPQKGVPLVVGQLYRVDMPTVAPQKSGIPVDDASTNALLAEILQTLKEMQAQQLQATSGR